MARFFLFDRFNTYYDWGLRVVEKDVGPAEPRTNYVTIDGASGTLDLTDALTGEVVYNDRTITATLETSEGTYQEREALIRTITTALHGRKVPIVEPDDPGHYYLGRVSIKTVTRHAAYITLTVEAVCEPWRYAVEETTRTVEATASGVGVVIRNNGARPLCPTFTVAGSVTITWGGLVTKLGTGTYRVADIRLPAGANVLTVAGSGSVVITYREADL